MVSHGEGRQIRCVKLSTEQRKCLRPSHVAFLRLSTLDFFDMSVVAVASVKGDATQRMRAVIIATR